MFMTFWRIRLPPIKPVIMVLIRHENRHFIPCPWSPCSPFLKYVFKLSRRAGGQWRKLDCLVHYCYWLDMHFCFSLYLGIFFPFFNVAALYELNVENQRFSWRCHRFVMQAGPPQFKPYPNQATSSAPCVYFGKLIKPEFFLTHYHYFLVTFFKLLSELFRPYIFCHFVLAQ